MYEKKPWLRFYGATPATLSYPELSMYGAYHNRASSVPSARRVCAVSRGLAAEGLHKGDRVLVCMPNVPQAVIVFYALNRLGAIPAMIHPLSAPSEIRAYATQTS